MRRDRVLVLLVTALVVAAPGTALAADPFSNGQGVAEATLEEEVFDEQPPVKGPRVPTGGGGPSGIVYREVPLYGPCVNRDGVAGVLIGIEMTPPGEIVSQRCSSEVAPPAAPPIDFGSLERTAVAVTARVAPDPPELRVQPDGRALVNQPVVLSVADPGAPPSASEVNPLSGRTVTVVLGAPSYEWDFGSGWVRGGRGKPYDGGTVPREGRGKPYVSHTWSRTGTSTVRVRATYDASYTITGFSDVFDLPPVVVTSEATLQVVQSRSELVRD